MQYQDWTVIDVEPIIKNYKKYYKCECTCGNIKDVLISNLQNNLSKRCKSCSSKSRINKCGLNNKNTKMEGKLSGTMYSHIKSKARERNLIFNLSKKFLGELFTKQNEKCALSGIDITLSTEIKNNNPDFKFITASLDRIDSSIGYIETNVQWVHKDINKMKMAYDNQYFIDMCKLIARYNDNIEPS